MLHCELIGVSKNTNFLMRLLIIACCYIQSTCPNPDVLIGVCLCPSQKGDFFKLIYEALKSISFGLSLQETGISAERWKESLLDAGNDLVVVSKQALVASRIST